MNEQTERACVAYASAASKSSPMVASIARTARACNASNFFTVSPKSKVVEHPRFTGAVKTHIFFDE